MTAGGTTRLARRVRAAVAAVAVLVAVACTPIYQNHGYIPTEEELALIEVGTDTRETVAATLGRPSASGLLNDVGWFYVQSRWETKGAREPKEIDRQVVVVSFDDQGTVENVERFGLERGRVVVISRRVTDSNIKGLGFLKQLLGSIGQLRADKIVD